MTDYARFGIAQSSCDAWLPRVKVGVLRNQSESLLSPANDVVPYLDGRPDRWDVKTFDERDFGGLLGAAEFDVIVIGYNATLYTPQLRQALEREPPTTPVLMLHQRDQDCFAFLRDDLAVQVVRLGTAVREARTPSRSSPAFEPLLNWPHAGFSADGTLAARAIRGLSFSPDGAWRIVLEAYRGAQKVPALIRTRSDHRQRLVATSLLLQPRPGDAHGQLLENLLVYCAFGWPDVALVHARDDPEAEAQARGLASGMAMWTERCVRVAVPTGHPVSIEHWPLRGARRVVAHGDRPGAEFEPQGPPEPWLRRGGELVRISRAGRITVTGELADRYVVVREWAMWFGRLPDEAWLTRLSPAYGVLR